MALTPAHIQAAQAVQHAAAHDAGQHVLVVAGPGTDKSSAIEEKVRWLLSQGVQPAGIYAVSFTRASALDLRQRIHAYCAQNGQPAGSHVRVTTLHSLALRTLRAAGLLAAYPSEPQVMDTWELDNVFDAEFGDASGIGKQRRERIRLEHEAFWSTGLWGPRTTRHPIRRSLPPSALSSQHSTDHEPSATRACCRERLSDSA